MSSRITIYFIQVLPALTVSYWRNFKTMIDTVFGKQQVNGHQIRPKIGKNTGKPNSFENIDAERVEFPPILCEQYRGNTVFISKNKSYSMEYHVIGNLKIRKISYVLSSVLDLNKRIIHKNLSKSER